MAADTTGIMEGFLCPVCLKDFGTVSQLQDHFEDAHSSEDKAVLQSLKGFFDKAKRRILGNKEFGFRESNTQSIENPSTTCFSGYDPTWWEYQELGVTHYHTDAFRAVRDARIDHFVVETNKLLIRLDKLLDPDAPREASKRKGIVTMFSDYLGFEKSIVPWVPDGAVPACLSCEESFSILRRKHHCRLCGGIMCNKCSEFLGLTYAQKLVNPAVSFEGESGFLKRSDSSTSLNSLMGLEAEGHMRICKGCRMLLERRDQMTEQRNIKPTLVLLYEKMRACMRDANELIPEYLPMVDSLSIGEATYNWSEAQALRNKLVRLYDAVDQLSKRILSLEIKPESPSALKQQQLQKAIRVSASYFMQENLIGLQALPSEDQYEELKTARRAEIQRKIAAERQAEMEAQQRERQSQDDTERSRPNGDKKLGHTRNDSHDSVGKGWKPVEEGSRVSKVADPMLQQMEIIRGYIKQAKEAQRWDEVEMLEHNLKDLKDEYYRQQTINFQS
ncbi:rabenosyn-5 [Patella vulgata]|uniref:rabenosyn-5 n=1 Tax=Patella vulgata TaxID=6465 RepID=UPI0021803A6B|nr:rabenosyn-5 [Patella vulgata]